jgi:hypothetical protein
VSATGADVATTEEVLGLVEEYNARADRCRLEILSMDDCEIATGIKTSRSVVREKEGLVF